MTDAGGWAVVIPLKGGPSAKSRLGLDPEHRSTVALAFAADTLAAVRDCGPVRRVVVVTSDPACRDLAGRAAAAVVPDPGTGLRDAVVAGLQSLTDSGYAGPTAALQGDLPALRAADLADALGAGEGRERSFVPDAEGVGTVLLMGARPGLLEVRFGAGSASRHEAAGHRRLDLDLPGLRRDVDDLAELAAVRLLGVGAATTRALHRLPAGVRPFGERSAGFSDPTDVADLAASGRTARTVSTGGQETG